MRPIAVDHRAAGADDLAIPDDDIAVAVDSALLEQSVPVADVGPAHPCFDHGGTVGILHHRVIDRFALDLGEMIGVGADGSAVRLGCVEGSLGQGGDFGPMAFELGEELACAESEDPAVPCVATIGEKAHGGFQVGLFDEAVHTVAIVQRIAPADVAIAGFGRGRLDTECDEPVLGGEFRGGLCGAHESVAVDDMVIARTDQHDGVGRKCMGCQRNCGCGVATHGLNDKARVRRNGCRLRLRKLEMLVPDHDDRRAENGLIRTPLQRRLEQGSFSKQGNERLRLRRPAPRPQARSAASAQDNRHDVAHLLLLANTFAGAIADIPFKGKGFSGI